VDKKEILLQLNELKKHTFYELLNLAGRAYILVKYSKNVKVGSRGFLPEESIQKCFIPVDDIIAVYSLELNSQLVIGPQPVSEANIPEKKQDNFSSEGKVEGPSSKEEKGKKKKVVRVDFQKKRK